jgi:Terminase small subunit
VCWSSAATELRKNPKIRAAINAGLQKLQLSREEIIRAAERIVEANPKDLFDENGQFDIAKLPDDLARVIKKVKQGEFGTEVEWHSPLEAATFLAKIHRLFGEFGDQGDAGGTTITIVQLLQQAILP